MAAEQWASGPVVSINWWEIQHIEPSLHHIEPTGGNNNKNNSEPFSII